MDRRNFIKASLCIGAVAATCGCIYGSKFVYNAAHPENKFKLKSNSELPRKVRLEACNDCQLNCPACGIRLGEEAIIKNAGGFGYLKFEDFKNFVDKHDFIEEIELSNNGEIFLNPELDDIIKYAHEKGITLTAYNGVNLNTVSDETLENLVKYQFSGMSVSIDGATPETYKIYRRGGDFNTVISNIKKINKFKEQYNSEYPYLAWQFILFGHNEHEIDKARELAEELNMEINFIVNTEEGYSPLKDKKMVAQKTGLTFLDNSAEASFENNNWDNVYCYDLVNCPQINFNGDLLGCCQLFWDTFKVNVFKEGLLGTMNHKNVLDSKLMLSDFSVEGRGDLPCTTCPTYLLLKEENKPIDLSKIQEA